MTRRIEETKIFRKMIENIGKNHDRLSRDELSGFLAMHGSSYSGELMVIGRAVNGWSEGWQPSKMMLEPSIQKVVAQTLNSVDRDSSCPMLWVTELWGSKKPKYNTKTSAFWRVIRMVVDELKLSDIDSDSWPSCLVWSNLYKISPFKGGNPSNKLCALQFEDCAELLALEFDLFKPERALFLTGYDWAEDFVTRYTNVSAVKEPRHVEATGIYQSSNGKTGKIVVAKHPQGKEESIWVEEVIQAFN